MLNSIKDTLNITRNARNIKSNSTMNDTLLSKVSFLEVEIQNHKEDFNENIKAVKHLTEFNRQTNEKDTNTLNERIEELEDENLELKAMLLKTSKHILKKDEEQRKINMRNNEDIQKLNRLVLKLSEKLDRVLENNYQPVENNNEEILEQIEKVDDAVMKIYHYKGKQKTRNP